MVSAVFIGYKGTLIFQGELEEGSWVGGDKKC